MVREAPKKRPPAKRAAKPRSAAGKLAAYRAKRDFSQTSEPRGRAGKDSSGRYFIQRHAASHLHYDFRLEIDGVLKSWAIPKQIPVVEGEKRLAVHVEDHPLEYGNFEGTIPQGEYGGGTVQLWDRGRFRVRDTAAVPGLKMGKLHLFLEGEKLRGEWALVRIRGEEKQWLLIAIKVHDARRTKWKASVKTVRHLAEIAREDAAAFVEPMKAKPVAQPPAGEGWLFELKFDGYRFIAVKNGKTVRLWSRTEKELTARFPGIVNAVGKLPAKSLIMDGELIVPDEQGHPRFQLIQNADEKTPVQAFGFDLLALDGADLRGEPLDERRARLAQLLKKPSAVLHFSDELKGDPETLLEEISAHGLEGLIGKRRDSPYEAGRRSGAWVKIKCLLEQEFVVGGFTAPKGAREKFGALMVGYYRGKTLTLAGRVGTGFDGKTLRAMHAKMQALKTADCPFATLPTKASRWGKAFTGAELARCVWVRPEIVVQVRFAEWTDDGILRQPAYLGLRDDKPARKVVRET